MMKRTVLTLLRAYKWLVSPLLGPACRYVPSCSEYAMEAVARYGVLKGGLKALWRLARCHPLAKGGFDPVVSRQSPVASPQSTDRTERSRKLATGNWRLATPPKESSS